MSRRLLAVSSAAAGLGAYLTGPMDFAKFIGALLLILSGFILYMAMDGK